MLSESKTYRVTPAGRVYMRFLATFNTGDPLQMSEFISENFADDMLADHPVSELVDWYETMFTETGGMKIEKVFATEEYFIMVVVQANDGGQTYMDKLKITEAQPYKVLEYFHEPAAPLT